MGNIEIYNVEQGSNAWFDLRCGRITGSKFKDMMSGLSTLGYKSLINTVIGEIISETVEPGYSNADMERGIEMEPRAARYYSMLYEIETEEVGFVTNLDLFPDYIGVSPDRIVGDGLLEIKCPKMKTHIGYLRGGKLPNEYKWQVQGQMLITGALFCDFMSYYPGIKPFILRVFPDKKMQTEMKQRIDFSVQMIIDGLKEIQ